MTSSTQEFTPTLFQRARWRAWQRIHAFNLYKGAPSKAGARLLYGAALVEKKLRGGDAMHPPPLLATLSGGFDVAGTGRRIFGQLEEHTNLAPDSRVLDIGCGCGRVAIPLTDHLTEEGSYDGFDVLRPVVWWCRRTIEPRWPNFRFKRVDVFNALYNPKGAESPTAFRFPYEDDRFDVVYAASVFTHMPPEEIQHYLHEIRRTLKPGGRVLATLFALDERRHSLMSEGKLDLLHSPGTRPGRDERAAFFADRPEQPGNVGVTDETFASMLDQAGLVLRGEIVRGSWDNEHPGARDSQDLAVLERPAG